MATLATVGSSSVLRFNKTEPLKTNPSSPFLGFVTSQLSGIKISCNLPVVVAPLKPISSPFTPALLPVARYALSPARKRTKPTKFRSQITRQRNYSLSTSNTRRFGGKPVNAM
uniref:Uncharacterized protein n=1 Tax=Gossypium raimondii TaxID=29730 RepID=A0A0D2R970_GOSRA|nr:hypothetical protein B456_005G052000 [Gossypium raimondii]